MNNEVFSNDEIILTAARELLLADNAAKNCYWDFEIAIFPIKYGVKGAGETEMLGSWSENWNTKILILLYEHK